MGADEEGTLAQLKAHRNALLDPKITEHQGRIVKTTGDGILAEFASVIDALRCAIEIQRGMLERNANVPQERRIEFRAGINVGDIIIDSGDIYGDGVNVAARLEGLAEPGGICVSGRVQEDARGKVDIAFEDAGEQQLKNIAWPVRVYRVNFSGEAARPRSVSTLPAKPSIAVLPFTNMSGDPEQEYFSDGITEDIITDLSHVSALFVAARHTAFVFKGKAVKIIEAARQLNVACILEGSVRKAGNRVRITAQLIDGTTGGHIWAERFDRELVDIFDVQDEIAKRIVSALKVKLVPKELESIGDRSTSNADAYEYYLQGRAKFYESWGSKLTMSVARRQFSKAVEIDPGYAKAYTGIACCDAFLWVAGDLDISPELILANSDKALQLAPNMAEAHASRAMALYATGRSEGAAAGFARAIELDPALFGVHFFYGLVSRDLGDLDTAAAAFQTAAAQRMDDYASLGLLADVYEAQGLHEESKAAARRCLIRVDSILSQRPDAVEVLGLGAANAVYLEDFVRAEKWAQHAVQLEPDNFTARYNVACAYAVMGKVDLSMEHLQYIYTKVPKARPWLSRIMPVDAQLRSLHGRADFQELKKRLEADASSRP
jgi:adenylate cyclase